MELANQVQPKNPLDDDVFSSDFTVVNNEYSIQLDPETVRYLSMKKKAPLSVSNEEEMRRETIPRFCPFTSLFFFLCRRTDF